MSTFSKKGGMAWIRTHLLRTVLASVPGGSFFKRPLRTKKRAHITIVKARPAILSDLSQSFTVFTVVVVLIKSFEPPTRLSEPGLHDI